jgi:hypothetical protein
LTSNAHNGGLRLKQLSACADRCGSSTGRPFTLCKLSIRKIIPHLKPLQQAACQRSVAWRLLRLPRKEKHSAWQATALPRSPGRSKNRPSSCRALIFVEASAYMLDARPHRPRYLNRVSVPDVARAGWRASFVRDPASATGAFSIQFLGVGRAVVTIERA